MLRCPVYEVEVAKRKRTFAFAYLEVEPGQCNSQSSILSLHHYPMIFIVPHFDHTVFRNIVSRKLQVAGGCRTRSITLGRQSHRQKEYTVDCLDINYSLVDFQGGSIALSGEVCFSDQIVESFI